MSLPHPATAKSNPRNTVDRFVSIYDLSARLPFQFCVTREESNGLAEWALGTEDINAEKFGDSRTRWDDCCETSQERKRRDRAQNHSAKPGSSFSLSRLWSIHQGAEWQPQGGFHRSVRLIPKSVKCCVAISWGKSRRGARTLIRCLGEQSGRAVGLVVIGRRRLHRRKQQEGDFDPDTRWALAWFKQSGFAQGEFGVAETLSKAKNTSVSGMVEAGIIASKSGKVQLLRPNELPEDWDASTDARLTVWETVHHLIRVLEDGGESAAAALVVQLGTRAEVARELAYRLYTVCEQKKRAKEALSYNALVQSWPEIIRLSQAHSDAESLSLFS